MASGDCVTNRSKTSNQAVWFGHDAAGKGRAKHVEASADAGMAAPTTTIPSTLAQDETADSLEAPGRTGKGRRYFSSVLTPASVCECKFSGVAVDASKAPPMFRFTPKPVFKTTTSSSQVPTGLDDARESPGTSTKHAKSDIAAADVAFVQRSIAIFTKYGITLKKKGPILSPYDNKAIKPFLVRDMDSQRGLKDEFSQY